MNDKKGNQGKQNNQKMKPYLVMQFLLKNTDANNVVTADEIVAYLQNDCKIQAERRSIYKDIEEINKAMLIVENEIDIYEAEEMLADDTDNEDKFIVYDKSKKGFYAHPRSYSVDDIRLLAECVYSAKFLDKSQSKFLIDILCNYVSDKQAETIKHDVLLSNRIRTNNAEVINNIQIINEAMSKELDGKKHTPEKIGFKYLYYSISDTKKQVERRHGDKYIVSPFALLINDGYYYLLGFDDKSHKFKHFRIDRMKSVDRIGEPREDADKFREIDLSTYTQRVFSMYSGKEERIKLRFINPLLDAVIDRFGTKDTQYFICDKNHFEAVTKVQISSQFYGWLLGFGKKAKIISPPEIREEFISYIDDVRNMYKDE